MTRSSLRGAPLLVLFAFACKGEEVLGDGKDSDGDGLSDEYEAGIGSDPESADTDRDGWDDRVEVEGNTNPLNGYDHPYEGGWPIGACRDEVVSTGNTVGSVAEDFSLMDQHLDGIQLHAFCDRVVVLAAAAQWCDPCRAEAAGLADLYDRYAPQGLMVVTLLGEDVEGQTAGKDDLIDWASTWGITHPVLQDVGFTVASRYTGLGSAPLPSNTILSRGLRVEVANSQVIDEDFVIGLLSAE